MAQLIQQLPHAGISQTHRVGVQLYALAQTHFGALGRRLAISAKNPIPHIQKTAANIHHIATVAAVLLLFGVVRVMVYAIAKKGAGRIKEFVFIRPIVKRGLMPKNPAHPGHSVIDHKLCIQRLWIHQFRNRTKNQGIRHKSKNKQRESRKHRRRGRVRQHRGHMVWAMKQQPARPKFMPHAVQPIMKKARQRVNQEKSHDARQMHHRRNMGIDPSIELGRAAFNKGIGTSKIPAPSPSQPCNQGGANAQADSQHRIQPQQLPKLAPRKICPHAGFVMQGGEKSNARYPHTQQHKPSPQQPPRLRRHRISPRPQLLHRLIRQRIAQTWPQIRAQMQGRHNLPRKPQRKRQQRQHT